MRLPTLPLLLATALAVLALGGGAASASATPTTLFVDPVAGHDFGAGTGTETNPLKTIGRALDLAHAGDTVQLGGGRYAADSNHEVFTNGFGEARLRVPAGVTVAGEPDPAKGRTIIVGPGSGVGLQMDGDATLKTMFIAGFKAGVRADRGRQTLTGVDFSGDGIELAGSADLRYQTSVPDPLAAGERGGIFTNLRGPAVRIVNGAQVRVVGAVIKGTAGACDLAQRGIVAERSSGVTITGVRFIDLSGNAVFAGFGSQVAISGVSVDAHVPQGCSPAPAIENNGFITIANTVLHNGGVRAGVAWQQNAPQNGFVTTTSMDNWAVGIRTGDVFQQRLAMSFTKITGTSTGISAAATPNATVDVSDSTVTGGLTGIEAAKLKLRRTRVTGNLGTGVLLDSAAGDLGTVVDPGGNTLQGSNPNGTVRFKSGVGAAALQAVGNTWNPNVQGADASGRYPGFAFVDAQSPLATGTNFRLDLGQSIRLG